MTNRNAAESKSEYQELIAGRSPHKGFDGSASIALKVTQISETGLDLAISPTKTTTVGEEKEEVSTPSPGLRKRISGLFHHGWH